MVRFGSLLWASERSIIDIDWTLAIELVLFGVVFLLMRSLVFKPLLRLFDERRAQTEGTRAEARRLDAEADARSRRISRELQEVRIQAAAERERMRLLVKKREQEVLGAARSDAARMAADARARIAAERSAAEAEVPARAGELARLVVERVTGRAGGVRPGA